MPLLDEIRASKLIELAHARFDPNLKPAELKVLRDSASAKLVPAPKWGTNQPPVRAEFLRWLASDAEVAPHIDPRGLRVYAATIPGELDLEECHLLSTLDFRRCRFQGEINLQSAETRGVYVFDSLLSDGLNADGIIVHGPLSLKRIESEGEIRLPGAVVDRDLDCSGAKLNVKGDALSAQNSKIRGNVFLHHGFESMGAVRLLGAEIKGAIVCTGAKLNSKGDSLSADGARVGGGVFLGAGPSRPFESEGEIRLLGAEIRGPLVCTGARLRAKGDALSAHNAKIGGNVFLNQGFESDGAVHLLGAEITGDLDFSGAKVAAINCRKTVVVGDLFWHGIENPGDASLILDGAKVKNLRDDWISWPAKGNLHLDGLVYEEVTLHWGSLPKEVESSALTEELELSVEDRIEWLMRQPDNELTEAQPWMLLAKHLEGKGNRKGAKHVVYKYRCQLAQAKKKWWGPRRLSIAFAWLEEAPLRILYSIATAVLLGAFIFAGAGRSGAMVAFSSGRMIADIDHYPPFQPVVYSLENCLPLVKLGQDDKWMPDRKHIPQPWVQGSRWFGWTAWLNCYEFLAGARWLLILLGWVQATVFIAAVADRFKK